MKKLFCLLCSLLILVANQNVYANEQETTETNMESFLITDEPAMPSLDSNVYQINSNSSTINQRGEWIEEVTSIQEETYNQKVINVTEDSDYIIFEFETNEDNTINDFDENYNEITGVQILRVSYLKPESTLSNNNTISPYASVPTDPESGSSTKIVEYYGWSSGYTTYDKEAGLYKSIYNLAISLVPTKSVLVSWVISEAMGSAFDIVTNNVYITAQTLNKYYYRNKAGCAYMNGAWLPIVLIGQRRAFGWEWATMNNSDGEPIVYKNAVTNANNSKNPTNYDGSIEYKSHYNDDEWILNKVTATKNSGGYSDVFASVSNAY